MWLWLCVAAVWHVIQFTSVWIGFYVIAFSSGTAFSSWPAFGSVWFLLVMGEFCVPFVYNKFDHFNMFVLCRNGIGLHVCWCLQLLSIAESRPDHRSRDDRTTDHSFDWGNSYTIQRYNPRHCLRWTRAFEDSHINDNKQIIRSNSIQRILSGYNKRSVCINISWRLSHVHSSVCYLQCICQIRHSVGKLMRRFYLHTATIEHVW